MIISWTSNSHLLFSWLLAVLLTSAAQHAHRAKWDAHATGMQLLRRVLLQEERVPFEADQQTLVSSGSDSDATVTHEIHGTGRRVRMKYLMPKSAAGRVLVNDGSTRWEYDPIQRVAVRSTVYWRPATAATVDAVVQRLTSNYDVAAEPGSAEIERRPMDIVRITPRKGDRNRQVWWVDRQTGLVVKREVHDPGDNLHFTSTFSNVHFAPRIGRATFKFTPPKGVSVVHTRESDVATSIEQARHKFPQWGRLKAHLGGGFHFESAREIVFKGRPGIALQYSDGLIGFAWVQVKGPVSLDQSDKDARRIDMNGATGILTRRSRFAVLSWDRDGESYNIVSDLSERLLISLARRIGTR